MEIKSKKVREKVRRDWTIFRLTPACRLIRRYWNVTYRRCIWKECCNIHCHRCLLAHGAKLHWQMPLRSVMGGVNTSFATLSTEFYKVKTTKNHWKTLCASPGRPVPGEKTSLRKVVFFVAPNQRRA
jgi:hypothetical protein